MSQPNNNENDEDEEFFDFTPPGLRETAEVVTNNLLPTKSKNLYETTYTKFTEWKKEDGTSSSSQRVLLSYFDGLSKRYKPSSLWSIYSMLKCTLNLKEGIYIGNYKQLTSLLKRLSIGFQSKKSKVLMPEHIQKFIIEASDDRHLATKVI